MAYALGFDKDITDLIYSMRDWTLENVKRKGGTPSRLALKPFTIWNLKIHVAPPSLRFPDPTTYCICVTTCQIDLWILGLMSNRWKKLTSHVWAQLCPFPHCEDIDAAHGPQIHVVPRAEHDQESDESSEDDTDYDEQW